jgi:predicted metal-dependent hydrolase
MIEKKIASYPLVRSDRRTISINVDRNGEVTIRAPLKMPEGEILRFVEAKQAWIRQAVQRQQQKRDAAPAFSVGGSMPYLGGSLLVQTGKVRTAQLQNGMLVLPEKGEPKRHALRWLAKAAGEYLPGRVAYWSEIMQLKPASLTIANPKTRWGSMKSDGSLRLNAALMHCHPSLIDYVIVHELSHMVHMDHSPAFHAYTERYLPDAKARRTALKQQGAYLTLLRQE